MLFRISYRVCVRSRDLIPVSLKSHITKFATSKASGSTIVRQYFAGHGSSTTDQKITVLLAATAASGIALLALHDGDGNTGKVPSPSPKASNFHDMLAEIDSIRDSTSLDDLIDLQLVLSTLREARKPNLSSRDDAMLLWRLGRALLDVTDLLPPSTREALLHEAATVVEQALASGALHDGELANALRWAGIILEAKSSLAGTKEYIKSSYRVRDFWERALQANPNDAAAWHLLGRWYAGVATLPSWKRSLARMVFAAPPTGSLQQAKDCFLKAESIQPGFWQENQRWLAEVEHLLGNDTEAVVWSQKVISSRPVSRFDRDSHAKAEALLSRLKSTSA